MSRLGEVQLGNSINQDDHCSPPSQPAHLRCRPDNVRNASFSHLNRVRGNTVTHAAPQAGTTVWQAWWVHLEGSVMTPEAAGISWDLLSPNPRPLFAILPWAFKRALGPAPSPASPKCQSSRVIVRAVCRKLDVERPE